MPKTRAKITSTFEASRIMAAATKKIKPPDCVDLDDADLPFFDAVIAEFARADWTEHQLQLAAMLARMMNDLQNEQKALRAEGSVAYSDKGTPVINPRKTAVQMYAGSILSMRRSLSLHARATGEARDKGKRNKISKEMEANGGNDDDLLARPSQD